MMGRELRHLNYEFGTRAFDSKASWLAYAQRLRTRMKVSLALAPEPPKAPLAAQVFGRWEGDGYVCEKAAFESLPGFYVTGNLFRPAKANERFERAPGILCPHGHWPDGRLHDYDERGSVIARCATLARMGANVFSWDMVGYNDSCQLPHREFGADRPWGLSLMALQTWNSIRSVDFLLEVAGVDPGKIGVTGASGGGTQTFIAMTVDERIAAAAPICMISYHMQGGCLCENAPLLRLNATNVDIARLFAPKPLFLGSCTGDWTRNTPERERPDIAEAYRFLDAEDRVSGHHVDAGHNYNQELREAVYGFFGKWFFGAVDDEPVSEAAFQRPPLRDRMVWWGREAPAQWGFDQLKAEWRDRAESALRPLLRDAATTRERLGCLLVHVLGVDPDSAPGSAPSGVSVRGEGDALVVEPNAEPSPQESTEELSFFDTYNLPPVAERVQEILGVVKAASAPVRLVGEGAAGLWCLLAGAVCDKVRALDVDMAGFDPASDESWTERCDLPSIRQIGGLATVFALIGARPFELRNATEEVRAAAAEFAQ